MGKDKLGSFLLKGISFSLLKSFSASGFFTDSAMYSIPYAGVATVILFIGVSEIL